MIARPEFAVGEVYELGQWHDGSLEGHAVAEAALKGAMDSVSRNKGVTFGPLQWEDLPADHGRVPKPAEGARMLVCWAEVKAARSIDTGPSILHDLEPDDLERLRRITRAAHQRLNPHKDPLPIEECDRIIDRVAPKTIERMLRQGLEGSAVQ